MTLLASLIKIISSFLLKLANAASQVVILALQSSLVILHRLRHLQLVVTLPRQIETISVLFLLIRVCLPLLVIDLLIDKLQLLFEARYFSL